MSLVHGKLCVWWFHTSSVRVVVFINVLNLIRIELAPK